MNKVEAGAGDDLLKVFTLNSAYEQIGGFGIFQVIATLCLIFIRNFGTANIYMFGLSTAVWDYVCRASDNDPWKTCSREIICSLKDELGF